MQFVVTMPNITYNIVICLKIVPFSAMINYVDRSCNEGQELTTKRIGELYNCFSVRLCVSHTSTIMVGPRRETTKGVGCCVRRGKHNGAARHASTYFTIQMDVFPLYII